MLSYTMWYEGVFAFEETRNDRTGHVIDAVWTHLERSRNVVQTFPSIPGFYDGNEDNIRFVLRWYCVSAVVSTSLNPIHTRPSSHYFNVKPV